LSINYLKDNDDLERSEGATVTWGDNFYKNLILIAVDFIKTTPNWLRFGCTIEEAKAPCLKNPIPRQINEPVKP